MYETYNLYNNTVVLSFNPAKHHYTVDNNTVDGVTSVLGVIAKPALIAWAANMAHDYILAELKPGCALDEVDIKDLAVGAKNAHRVKRDKSADIGGMFHAWAENYIKTGEKTEVFNEQLQNTVDAFLAWEEENKIEWIHSEVKVYSKEHNFAGTFDFIAKINGKMMLGDFKTSSGIYPEMFAQTSAYQIAYQEEHPEAHFDGQIIVNIRKDGTFEHLESDALSYKRDKQAFLNALGLYRWTKENK